MMFKITLIFVITIFQITIILPMRLKYVDLCEDKKVSVDLPEIDRKYMNLLILKNTYNYYHKSSTRHHIHI